eukprot:3005539-Pyramimonas_sp.AAC.1
MPPKVDAPVSIRLTAVVTSLPTLPQVVLPLVLGPNACDRDSTEEPSDNQSPEERQLEALIGPGGAYLQLAVFLSLAGWTARGRCVDRLAII